VKRSKSSQNSLKPIGVGGPDLMDYFFGIERPDTVRGPDIVKIFSGFKVGDWVHCLHCSRYYKIGEFRVIKGLQYCPYPGCDGDAVTDVFGKWQGSGEPERGKVYDDF
jgi:hypothetical protein